MKSTITTTLLLLLASMACLAENKTERQEIRISTDKVDLIFEVASDQRLYQIYLGERLSDTFDLTLLNRPECVSDNGTLEKRKREVYSCAGNEDYFEPALGIIHADGNRSSYLRFKEVKREAVKGGEEIVISLEDDQYPVKVDLHYVTYAKENIIKTWSILTHREKKNIVLTHMYSTMLYLEAAKYYLTEYASDWAEEVRQETQELTFGKKMVDTKLGSRANLFCQPFFEIGLNQPSQEQQGTVLMGTIGWTGNWRYTLEVDNNHLLCLLPGINPTASEYTLKPHTEFSTPEFIFTLSFTGSSSASRNFHDWAREYQIKDGMGQRISLLNNWENTYFDFDEEKLAECMKEANNLGVDLFLLDDGWFGNGDNAREGDYAGLGDWEVNHQKLPNGIPGLVKKAKESGVKFGIWIEPEMINPRSELMAKHPDWVIRQPNRDTYYYRNQLVLNLSNPQVQDYVFNVVDRIMTENPEVAFFKWDCNAPITNIYSSYHGSLQGNLYIDHAQGVRNVMKRVAEKYPHVPMMLCSGGGGRCDYESLKYFTEFWCSDNTDPVERIFIQWGFSKFFPAKAMCAHVTSWNKSASVKFRTDVASMCKLGFDIGLKELSADELEYCKKAIANWKRLNPAILEGDQYRLVSPYETNHMAVNYVSKDKREAVLFAYDVHPRFSETLYKVRPQGLDPNAMYKIEEINLMPGNSSNLKLNGSVVSGEYLMKVGLDAFTCHSMHSRVITFVRQ